MPKRLVPILGLMAVWLGLNQSAALAYESCIPPAPSEALQMADVVFAGKAIEANQQAWRISHMKFDCDLARRLSVLFLFLALLGWAIQGLRRKYGDQKS